MSHADLRSLAASEWVPSTEPAGVAPSLRIIWAVPVLTCGAIGWLVAGPLWAAAAAAAVALSEWGWVRVQGGLVLHSLHAAKLRPEQAPQLFNIAQGLAGRVQAAVPRIWLIPAGGPNALVLWAGGPSIAITRSLLDDFTRTELEAVVAHCLVRLPRSRALSEALALRRLRISVPPPDVLWADAATAALTRYPPALGSAITKAQPRAEGFGLVWFVSGGSGQTDPSTRAEMLQDL